MTAHTAGAYITGLFDKTKGWVGDQIQSEMLASSMTDYVFWSIHVLENGDLHMNDVPICVGGAPYTSTTSYLSQFISAAQAKGVNSIWFSLGSGGVPDFYYVGQILNNPQGAAYSNFFANLKVLVELGGVGFDYDYEPYYNNGISQGYDQTGIDTLTGLSAELFNRFASKISYCPYQEQSFWLSCLQATYSKIGLQPVVAYRLQCYDGGAGNNPADWASTIAAAGSASTGVTDPTGLMRPGMAVAGGARGPLLDPSQMTAQLKAWGVPGGWIWNSEQVVNVQPSQGFSIADYASAILAGDV